MPIQRVSEPPKTKSSFFSDMSPLGNSKKYTFHLEQEYYNHYAKSYFAVTTKKAGWDCLRHYEIAASGTLPYFLDIHKCPKNTLFMWPKELLQEIKNLPGVPSEIWVKLATRRGKLHLLKKGKSFDEAKYSSLREDFLKIFRQNLTTEALANYFLKTLSEQTKSHKNPRRILLCFGVHGGLIDYMRDLLILALASHPDIQLSVYPTPFWLFKSCHPKIRGAFYGRGFTYSGILESEQIETFPNWDSLEKQIDSYDHVVATTSSNVGITALPQEVQSALSHKKNIIWVDGNDIRAQHTVPPFANIVFQRELT